MSSVKSVINTDKAPRPGGCYSQGIRVGNLLFVSGEGPIDPVTGRIVGEEIREQTARVLENIKAIVEAAGGTLEDIVKVSVNLKDMKDFSAYNEVYSTYFPKNPPARHTSQAFIDEKMLVAMDAIAYIP